MRSWCRQSFRSRPPPFGGWWPAGSFPCPYGYQSELRHGGPRTSVNGSTRGNLGNPMTRNELYRAVWSDPVFHVAKRIGISNRGLLDICRSAEVPTPPRGYWRRIQTGQTPEKSPLVRPGDDSNIPISLDGTAANVGALPSEAVDKPPPAQKSKNESAPLPTAKTGTATKDDWLEIPIEETRSASATKGEYQKLISLAGLFERHQLVSAFLTQVEEVECQESLRTATIIRQWTATMRRHHAEANPVEQILAEFRALSFGRQKPHWWDSP